MTQFGQFLRSTRIDALPQLINVLRGEMRLADIFLSIDLGLEDGQGQHRKTDQRRPTEHGKGSDDEGRTPSGFCRS